MYHLNKIESNLKLSDVLKPSGTCYVDLHDKLSFTSELSYLNAAYCVERGLNAHFCDAPYEFGFTDSEINSFLACLRENFLPKDYNGTINFSDEEVIGVIDKWQEDTKATLKWHATQSINEGM